MLKTCILEYVSFGELITLDNYWTENIEQHGDCVEETKGVLFEKPTFYTKCHGLPKQLWDHLGGSAFLDVIKMSHLKLRVQSMLFRRSPMPCSTMKRHFERFLANSWNKCNINEMTLSAQTTIIVMAVLLLLEQQTCSHHNYINIASSLELSMMLPRCCNHGGCLPQHSCTWELLSSKRQNSVCTKTTIQLRRNSFQECLKTQVLIFFQKLFASWGNEKNSTLHRLPFNVYLCTWTNEVLWSEKPAIKSSLPLESDIMLI